STAGALSGTPTSSGTFNFTALLTDSAGATATKGFAITVVTPPLTITTASPLTAGTVGAAYSQTLVAIGGTAPYSWSLISGDLPGGLSLGANGTLSGTPTNADTFNFV